MLELRADEQDIEFERIVSSYGDIDPRFEARLAEVGSERLHRRNLLMIAALGALAFVALISVIARAAIFDVDEVRVLGSNKETVTRIRNTAAIKAGIAIWSVDLGAVERRVEKLPWVAEASVDRNWPDTITITIREYKATAYVRSIDGAVVLLGADGRVLEHADTSPPGVVEVVGVRSVPQIGDLLYPPEVGSIMVAIPHNLARRVDTIDVSDGLTLRLRSGSEILLCDATDLVAKADIAVALLKQQTAFQYIDVCVATAPTIR